MKISFDTKADAIYIKFKDGKFKFNKEVEEGVIIDFGENNEILGIEILEASTRFSIKDISDINIQMPLELVG